MRASGAQMWWSWNARRRNDAVDIMLRGATPPSGAAVVHANWRDNPWFTAELEQERQDCLRMAPEDYDHIWEGGYISSTAGAYYAAALGQARSEGRIGVVSADPLLGLRAYWDIGGSGARADSTVIWIAQFCGREIRVLDFYEAQGQPLAAHIHWLRAQGHDRALCVLPHDGATHDRIHDVSFETALGDAGFAVEVVANQGAGAARLRIEAVRRLFGAMWFHEATTAGGIEALGWYHERRDEQRGIGLGPEHDWASHAADAFGLMAVHYELPPARRGRGRYAAPQLPPASWMAG